MRPLHKPASVQMQRCGQVNSEAELEISHSMASYGATVSWVVLDKITRGLWVKFAAMVAGSDLEPAGVVVSQMLLVETSKLTGAFEATDTSGVQIGLACCSTHLVACLACRAEGILTCCKVPTAAATIT